MVRLLLLLLLKQNLSQFYFFRRRSLKLVEERRSNFLRDGVESGFEAERCATRGLNQGKFRVALQLRDEVASVFPAADPETLESGAEGRLTLLDGAGKVLGRKFGHPAASDFGEGATQSGQSEWLRRADAVAELLRLRLGLRLRLR